MSSVRSSVVRVVARVASAPVSPAELLASIGLTPEVDPQRASAEKVAAEDYYDFLERATVPGDHGLPYRYAAELKPDDFSAMGLGLKTAQTLRDSLQRLVRYIVLLSDTLEYELLDEPERVTTLILTRPSPRRGARLANECALAAVVGVMTEAAGRRVVPRAVTFTHPRPASIVEAHSYFGCPVTYDSRRNSLEFDAATLAVRGRLADQGLSSFLLAHLEQLRSEQEERSLVDSVHATITDLLPDGLPKKSVIARRLGMSERTLHRRLAEEGETFQGLTTRARREASEALLADNRHSLAEVAFLVGFSDQSSFQRAFKGWTNQTPLSFRGSASASP
ncbi:AraC family transcriptional regulator [Nocardioides donggukensis]|uniref:AraC family transcriptional regulator n=1 Tax=Nocardioides donggukensis TaxID=2774019 RepID=A0A927K4K7_9ACTN|nr:AraC family transcriptional regulator [Nocardioides donggukensis]MBD8870597.1 AraC family transcriptional regulator [Nocardioides donggukensis]